MKTNTQRWMLHTITAIAAVAFIATSSFAETPKTTPEETTGQTMYPGMYGGMGPGHMGPGYMQQGGMGPGYMRQGGMGYGGGMGMMGYGGMGMMQALNLDKEQRAKLRGLIREERNARCKTRNEMLDVRDELAEEYDKPQPDSKAIGKLYSKMSEMRRHMLEQSVQMRNKVREMLNKEQKENFDRMHHGGMGYGGMGMMGSDGMGYGGMMNMME